MLHRLTAIRLPGLILILLLIGSAILLSGCADLLDGLSADAEEDRLSGSGTTAIEQVAEETDTSAQATTTTAQPDTTEPSNADESPPVTEPSVTAAPTTVPSRDLVAGGPREYVTVPTESPVVALTFDAAYDPAPLVQILATLKSAEVPATFFLTGEFVEDYPDATRSIIDAGHPIGNHSYSHPDFTELDSSAIRDQLQRTEELLASLGVADPRPLFRPPFGARNARVLEELANQGYVSVYWTIDTLDWKPERTPSQIRQTVLDKLQPGAIVLMHVGSRQTAEILPRLIADLKAEGYGFVALSQIKR